ncbi:MAG: glycosyltransferase family 4 protein [Clostridiales bacterium]|nr:glycosyltransferase family 4 protein [Clostridiales bacterium]
MKILSITAQKPHSTGSGTYLTELVRSFDRVGHRQAVVCGIFPSDSVDFPDGVACYPVFFSETGNQAPYLAAPCKAKDGPIKTLPFPVVGMSDIMPYESTRYRDLTPDMVSQFEDAFMSAVSRAVEDLDPDLIVCHHLFLLTALVRKHFPGRKIAGISHGTDLRQMVNCANLRDIVRPYVKDIDMALALHDEQRDRIKELFGMDGSKVAVIGSGYNDRLFNTEGRMERKPGEPVRICYAGKISRPKGVPEMLAALSMLAGDDEGPPFKLTMAGGCQDAALKDKLDGLPDYATWLGQIPQPALAELLRRTDIFVLPSYFEGLPLVLIEAMASGAVPVSTDLPGVKDWIDANVIRPNVIYVPMPEMKSIDRPTETGRSALVDDLASALKRAITGFGSGTLPGAKPDTSAITWDGVARRLLSLCRP